MEECKTPSPMVHLFRKDVTSGFVALGLHRSVCGIRRKTHEEILLIAVVVCLPSCMRATPQSQCGSGGVSGGPRAFGRVVELHLLVDGTPPISLVADLEPSFALENCAWIWKGVAASALEGAFPWKSGSPENSLNGLP